jgi:hypothetical protein
VLHQQAADTATPMAFFDDEPTDFCLQIGLDQVTLMNVNPAHHPAGGPLGHIDDMLRIPLDLPEALRYLFRR